MRLLIAGLFSLTLLLGQTGLVRSGGQPIPGATITAVQGERKLTTVTNESGAYQFEDMTAGEWTLEVQQFGFARVSKSMTLGSVAVHTDFTLELARPGDNAITASNRTFSQRPPNGATPQAGAAPGNRQAGQGQGQGGGRPGGFNGRPGGAPPGANGQRGGNFQQVQNVGDSQVTAELARNATPPEPTAGEESTDSFLLNGSLSRGLQYAEAGNVEGPGAPGGFRPGMDGGGMPGDNPFGAQNGDGQNAGGPGARGGPGGGGPGGGFGGRGGGGPGGGGPGGRGGFQGRPQRDAVNGGQNGGFIGNRARRGQQRINGMINFSLRNSALDATPYSINGQNAVKSSYAQSRFGFSLGGPLVIPKFVNSPNTFFFINYSGARARNPYRYVNAVPTLAERNGDFSDRATTLYDPTTHTPLPGNQIPVGSIDKAAFGLLSYVPLPNQPGIVQNYVFTGSTAADTDNLNVRFNQSLTKKDRVAVGFSFQRRDGNSLQPFGFRDLSSGSGWNADLSWSHTLAPRSINTARVAFNRSSSLLDPFFAGTADVAGALGIIGASRDPINYGPPSVSFTNFGPLSDASASNNHNQTFTAGDSITWNHGKHNMSFGGEFRRQQLNTKSDSNGRGSFSFSGLNTSGFDATGSPLANTGFDFADFLYGLPQSASIRFGSSAMYFRGSVYSAYGQDDWRVASNLSITLGLRYEYFTPVQEKYGHIANLAVAPGFTGVTVVTPATSGQSAALINSDPNNFSPRVGIAWKPDAKSKTQVRGGYGIYYNSSIYNQIASRMAQQPPFANTSSVSTSTATLLTLQSGLTQIPAGKTILNTYAVDPNYRLAYAQTWSTSIQRELPQGFFVELGYLGTKGTRLDIQRQPNRAAPGSPLTAEERLLIGNAVGFTYESSEGSSIYHAGQVRLQRRFRRGISGNVLYTYGKSIDNSSTFGGAGNTVAQNDKDLRAERGLSSFDQRHTLRGTFIWTSPIGTRSADTWVNRALKDWNVNGGVTYSSGIPFTARVLGNLADASGTGAIGAGRADSSGLGIDGSPYFNLGAFVLPPSGRFGNAGRNSIPGPATFSTNASLGRSFSLTERKRLEFRFEGTNITNHVQVTSIGTTLNALTYGLPLAAGGMRTITANLRFRF